MDPADSSTPRQKGLVHVPYGSISLGLKSLSNRYASSERSTPCRYHASSSFRLKFGSVSSVGKNGRSKNILCLSCLELKRAGSDPAQASQHKKDAYNITTWTRQIRGAKVYVHCVRAVARRTTGGAG